MCFWDRQIGRQTDLAPSDPLMKCSRPPLPLPLRRGHQATIYFSGRTQTASLLPASLPSVPLNFPHLRPPHTRPTAAWKPTVLSAIQLFAAAPRTFLLKYAQLGAAVTGVFRWPKIFAILRLFLTPSEPLSASLHWSPLCPTSQLVVFVCYSCTDDPGVIETQY